MNTLALLAGIVFLAFAVNVPLGYLREGCRKFSFGWFVYVHASIPFIIFARIKAGFSWKFIPLTLGAAVAGQFLGGAIRRRQAR